MGKEEKTGAVMFLAGLPSGALGYLAACPLWQLKTRLQGGTGLVDSKTVGRKSGGGVYFRASLLLSFSCERVASSHYSLPACSQGLLLTGINKGKVHPPTPPS